MKTVVLSNDLDSVDILGNEVYEKYIELLGNDIRELFLKSSNLENIDCPGCDSHDSQDVYKRFGINFKKCNACGSYYASPRPTKKELNKFYEKSEACIFWREQLLNLPDEKVYYIYGSRINWIFDIVDEYNIDTDLFVDYETKYPFFIRNLLQQNIFKKIGSMEPRLYEHMSQLPDDVLSDGDIDQYKGQVGMLTAFETIERMADPKLFFDLAGDYCRKGGILLLTFASCSGFEYQILGENATNINPVNRMNLLSMEAIVKQIENAGFEIIELSTPGRLDVEIVKNAIQRDKNIKIDPFWKYVLENRDEKTRQNLQSFLQANRLSSHVRIAAKKK